MLVALFNAVTFAIAVPVLYQKLTSENDLSAEKEIGTLVRATMRPAGDLNVARILQWASWPFVEDAMVVDSNLEEQADGGLRATGVVLNPVGNSHRPADFDTQLVLRAAKRAIETRRPVSNVLGGRAVPLEGPEGSWGACWIRRQPLLELKPVFMNLLPWFLFSTLILTCVTFFSVRQLVLKPVEVLAEGARRVRMGDLETRLAVPHRQDELADLVRSFNEMTDRVRGFNDRLRDEVDRATTEAERAQTVAMTQRRLAAMGELAAGIAHEINNPLGGLMNAVDVLRRGELPEDKVDRYLQLLETGLERIGRTVGQLLRFTPREAQTEAVLLSAVAIDAIALVRHRARRGGVKMRLSVPGLLNQEVTEELSRKRSTELCEPGRLPEVLGARHELGQAVLNLLVNSLDALLEQNRSSARPPARIAIEISEIDRGVKLVVEDNGPGVDERTLARVADLFFTTKDVGKGTGLGLSMVHNIVAAHEGELSFESEPGRGFRVEIVLPPYDEGALASENRLPGGELS